MRVEHYYNVADVLEERFKGVSRHLHGGCYCNDCKKALQAIKADRYIKVCRNISNPHNEDYHSVRRANNDSI